MTQQERQEFENLKLQVQKLTEIIQGNFNGLNVFTSKIVSKDKLIVEKNGIKLSSSSYDAGPEIRCGNQINDAGIKAEVGTLPNGSIYLSSSSTQPMFIMVGTTWTLLNIP